MSVGCFSSKARKLMRLVEEGGGAERMQNVADLVLPKPLNDILEDPDSMFDGARASVVQEAYPSARAAANNLLLSPSAAPNARENVRKISETIVFGNGGGFTFDEKGNMVIPSEFWERQTDWVEKDDDEDNKKKNSICPTMPSNVPICSSCGGNAFPDVLSKSVGICIGASTFNLQ